jgi:hypothetical protein
MQTLEFSPEEVEVLSEVLRNTVSQIDIEVLHTDTHDFKQILRRRRTILEHILGKLCASPARA